MNERVEELSYEMCQDFAELKLIPLTVFEVKEIVVSNPHHPVSAVLSRAIEGLSDGTIVRVSEVSYQAVVQNREQVERYQMRKIAGRDRPVKFKWSELGKSLGKPLDNEEEKSVGD